MTERKIYVVEESETNGDSCVVTFTFDKNEAATKARRAYDHLTKSEKKKNEVTVKTYTVPCEPGKSAEEAFSTWTEDMICYPDAYEVEVIVDEN